MFRTLAVAALSLFALFAIVTPASAQLRLAPAEAEAQVIDNDAGICIVAEAEPLEMTINGVSYSCTPSGAVAYIGWCRPDCNQMHCCSTTGCTLGDTMQHAGETLTCRATNQYGAPL